MVLRFKIGTAEEAQALAEATHILFLDVWEFNNEWADIRLSKDVVRLHLNSRCLPIRDANTELHRSRHCSDYYRPHCNMHIHH